jgi:hypothetical protein
MNGNELLQLIAIGAIAGAFGQGLRAIVGIKKASDEAAAQGTSLRAEGLDVGRLVFSLFIGAIAGGVGIFTITGFKPGATQVITPEIFFGVIGIGYAGTDFIEGFVRTQLPKGITQVALVATKERLQIGAGERVVAIVATEGIPAESAVTPPVQGQLRASAGQGAAIPAPASPRQADASDDSSLSAPSPSAHSTLTTPV